MSLVSFLREAPPGFWQRRIGVFLCEDDRGQRNGIYVASRSLHIIWHSMMRSYMLHAIHAAMESRDHLGGLVDVLVILNAIPVVD